MMRLRWIQIESAVYRIAHFCIIFGSTISTTTKSLDLQRAKRTSSGVSGGYKNSSTCIHNLRQLNVLHWVSLISHGFNINHIDVEHIQIWIEITSDVLVYFYFTTELWIFFSVGTLKEITQRIGRAPLFYILYYSCVWLFGLLLELYSVVKTLMN